MRAKLVHVLPVAALVTVSLAAPATAAVVNGTNGPDVLVGTAKADTIHGYGGADRIYGKAGPDRLYGGHDVKKDLLYGGTGNDRIFVGMGDHVFAGPGNDVIRVTSGGAMKTIVVRCGPGYDRVYAPAGIAAWLLSTRGCEKVVRTHS